MREMKDSGIEWIGQVPNNWKLKKGKYLFKQHNNRGNLKCLQLLSPSQKFGVIPQTLLEELTTQNVVKVSEKANLNDFKTVHVGDFCISLRSFQGGFEYSHYEGVVSPAYQIFSAIGDNLCDGYYRYLFKDKSFIDKMNSYTMTLRDGKNIAFDDFGNTYIPVPPKSEQEKIANFLDSKCSEIDATSADIQKEIEILEQYKRSLVFEAISKGINGEKTANASSDIWKEIPQSWKLVDIKYLFEIVKRIAGREGYNILSVTQKGLKVKDISGNQGQIAENYSGYQFVFPSDYVMNHMDLLTGWIDCSDQFGVTSPDYRVFRLRDKTQNNTEYYKYVMQCCYMCRIFYSLGQGVSTLGRWRLQTSAFMNFKVPVPPLREQKEIARYLNDKCKEIELSIEQKRKQLELLSAYKKSLIYEYVTGKKEVI
jgi:hypothetical protein